MSAFQPGKDVDLMRVYEDAKQAKLYALNEGWPFGDGPLQWFCHIEIRVNDTLSDPSDEVHMICDQCPQSIFCLSVDTYYRGFTWNLELLKSRIADHVLKCHPEAVSG